MSESTYLLEVEKLEAGYSKVPILNGVSLRCALGRITTIIGPNGCGKSTLLKAVVGLVRPSAGSLRLEGREIAGESPDRLLLSGVALVPQVRSVFPRMTVEENVKLGGYLLRDARLLRERIERSYATFPRLRERRGQMAGTLSGGEQRMLELARALILEPRLLLLDEPSAMLAPALLEQIFAKIREIRDSGTTVLLVEQNIRAAFSITDYVYVLDYGRNHLDGTPETCRADPELAALYMG